MQTHWAIRRCDPNSGNTIGGFLSSAENYGERSEDKVTVFRGIYGIGYMILETKKDLQHYDFSEFQLELMLSLSKNFLEDQFFRGNYNVVDVYYDTEKAMFIIYAIESYMALLETPMRSSNKAMSLKWSFIRTPEQVLKDVLVGGDRLAVAFQEHDQFPSAKFEYKRFSIEYDWTIEDFIRYIANENQFEWRISDRVLYIGPELKPNAELNAKKDYLNQEVDNISFSPFGMKITFDPMPLDLDYHWNGIFRVIWVKHVVGGVNKSNMTKGCFVEIGAGRVPFERYLDTLEGQQEKDIGLSKLTKRQKSFHSVVVGKITNDAGEQDYVDRISIEKAINQFAIKNPNDIIFEEISPQYVLEKLCKTTPYADDGAGIFFPKVTNPPNSIVFNPEGRSESAVLGPFLTGDGTPTYILPAKNSGDFRLQFPNGWCLYVDEEGTTYLQIEGAPTLTVPNQDKTKPHFMIHSDGYVTLNSDSNTYLDINLNGDGKININTNAKDVTVNNGTNQVSLMGHTHEMNNHVHLVSPLALVTIPGTMPTQGPNPTSTVGETDKHSKNFKVVQG